MIEYEDYLSRFFGNAKDLKEFLRLLKTLDEDEALQMITELIEGSKVKLIELRFSENDKRNIGQNLTAVQGHGYGTQRLFRDGAFHESEAKIPVVKIMDDAGRFAFLGQLFEGDRRFNLILAEVAPQFRRQGLFEQLYKAVCWYAFRKIAVSSVHGRAAIPRLSLFGDAEPTCDDWRMAPRELWDEMRGRRFKSTQLLHLWMMQANCYLRESIDESASSDEFVIIKPELFQCLDPRERDKLRFSYPKPRCYSPFKMHFKSALAY